MRHFGSGSRRDDGICGQCHLTPPWSEQHFLSWPTIFDQIVKRGFIDRVTVVNLQDSSFDWRQEPIKLTLFSSFATRNCPQFHFFSPKKRTDQFREIVIMNGLWEVCVWMIFKVNLNESLSKCQPKLFSPATVNCCWSPYLKSIKRLKIHNQVYNMTFACPGERSRR